MENRKGQAEVPGALGARSQPIRPAPATGRRVFSLPPSPLRLLAVVVLMLPVCVPAAGVYKWRDADGNIHYGDQPPPDRHAQPMDIEAAPPPDPGATQRQDKRQRLLDSYREDRERLQQQRTTRQEEQKRRAQNCTRARKALQAARNAAFLYEKTDDPYNPRILSDTERKARTRTLQEQAQKWCD